MGKLTLEDLRKLREEKKKEVEKRNVDGKDIQIIIGMGTCGIAAGAKETLSAFVDELDKRGLSNAIVKQTGCMGSCSLEPTVEVVMSDMPDVIYGKVNADVARRVVNEHIIGKRLLENHIQDKPSIDIVKG
jgi:NADP-reducing hydrogenase subunit HndB